MIRVVMIGGGYFGQYHINAWLRMTGVDLATVVVRSDERRHDLAALYPDVAFVRSLDDAGSLGTVDILDVATPPDSHAALIRPVLGRVPYVICQKPFCRSLMEAEALVADAQQTTTRLIVHENFRFMPWYRAIRREIDKGTLGALRQAHFRMRPGDGNGPDAYLARQPYFREMDRFLVHETGIHWIDVFRYLFGEPARVTADLWRVNGAIRGEDAGLLLFHWDNGLRALFDGNRTLDHPADNHRLTMGEFLVEGETASIRLDGFGRLHLRLRGQNSETPLPYDFQDRDFGGDCVYHFQNHVITHMTQGTALETEAGAYLRNIRIEEAVYRSADNQCAVNLGQADTS